MALVMLEAAELETLVQGAVARALAEHAGAPALLDRTGLARALSCSPSTVDTLRKRGLPTVFVGESPRFELSSVIAWLKIDDELDRSADLDVI